MPNHTQKRCADCGHGTGLVPFKTVLDNYERDFCGPVCVLRWARRLKISDTEQPKLQETNA